VDYRRLGATGIDVSEIGFGAWGIGGNIKGSVAYGPTDDRVSLAALAQAYESGITFYDTADFYGFGHSEELIGRALADVRQNIVIASKVGLLGADGRQDFTSGHIRRSVEASLTRLKTDYLDLYQCHSPVLSDLAARDGEAVATLRALRDEGKIRSFGISLRAPEDGPAAIDNFGFEVIQVNFNLVDQRARQNGLLQQCADAGVGVIGRTPLCFGFLTGAYSGEGGFDPDDHRSKWSPEQVDRWASAYRLFVSGLLEKRKQTHAQFALRYCLSYDGISTVIPGMLTAAEVEENAAAGSLGLFSRDEVDSMEQTYEDHTFFVGR
jgi:aryl-alcohol dehydrogenase-like predicted oxidoreductase